jgi:hypothetical protein
MEIKSFFGMFGIGRRSPRSKARAPRRTSLALEGLENRNLMSVTYHGGPLLQNVQIESVFYGQNWYYDQNLYQSTGSIDGYLNDISQSSYMDMLNEYGVGRGNFLDGVINLSNPSRGSVVDDTEIQSMLASGIRQGIFDAPSPNQLYFVFTTPNVLVTAGGENSQHDFLGYHNAFNDPALGPIYYAVIAHPVGNADVRGFNAFQQQTEVSSHELAEATTDPDTRTGWRDYSIREGEIGDLAVNNFALLDGYVVQAVYSNYYNGPIIPYDATFYSPGGFAAASTAGQTQLGTEAILFPGVHSMQASDIAASSKATDLTLLSANTVTARTCAQSAHEEFFAVLAAQERKLHNPLLLGHAETQMEAGLGRETLPLNSR